MSLDPANDVAEFDAYAHEYDVLLNSSLAISGENVAYFTDYKIRDLACIWKQAAADRPQAPRILDFGAGVGATIPHFQRHFPGSPLTCTDVSRKSLLLAGKRFGAAASFIPCDLGSLPFPERQFDIAFASCVFHHIPPENHVTILRELGRVLMPGGLLFLYEHNPYNPVVVRVVKGCAFDERAILIPASTLRQRVTLAGFNQVTSRYRVFFPRAFKWLRRLEDGLTWLPLGAQYYVHGIKP